MKYQQLAAILRIEVQTLIHQGQSKLPSEAKLSAQYHMSRQTVRHALQLLEDEGLIQRRKGSGAHIIHSGADSVRQIAVITTFSDDYIFPSILHDIRSCFKEAGYNTIHFTTENKVSQERAILTNLLEQKICAVLIEGSKTALPTPNSDLYIALKQREIPVLFLHGCYSNLQGFPCLFDDNFSGGYHLTQYLLSIGHIKIAGIFKSDDIQGPQRYHGMVSALRDHHISLQDDTFFWYNTEDRASLVKSEYCTLLDNFIQKQLQFVTAVVCYNDEIAYYLIKQLLKTGRKVPEDIAVVSFDNSFYSKISPVPITSLAHKNKRTGIVAATLLLDALSGKQERSLCMGWDLIKRAST